jgi:arabinogalactan endo-1,4-beta-galactosidase
MSAHPIRAAAFCGWAAAGAVLCGQAHAGNAAPALPGFSAGADISSYGYIAAHGGLYRLGGQQMPLPALLRRAGCNTARLRLWHRASPGEVRRWGRAATRNDLEYTIPLARAIKRQGEYLVLDMHFSDTWADPGHQWTPAAWRRLGYEPLRARVRAYAERVMVALRNASASPDMVMVGNEIDDGMLWPQGKLWVGGKARWGRLAGLLRAAIAGIDAGSGARKPAIMIQVAYFPHPPYAGTFLRNLISRGVRFDVVGYDFYPYWHGPLAHLRTRLTRLAQRVPKPIIVAETAYPWVDNRYNESWKEKPGMAFPFTPQGQAQYIRQVLRIVRGLPGSRGRGVWWWGAEYDPQQATFRGMQWSYRSLFDLRGEALPALSVLCKAAEPAMQAVP